MTLYQTIQGASRVFFPLENAWHHAAAGESPDGHWRVGCDSLGDAPRGVWAKAAGGIDPASGALRIFSGRKMADSAARAAISALGCLAWPARRHCRARRRNRP